MILPVPIYGQRDNRWAKQRLGTVNGVTIGSDGCIITDMAMMATYYGHPIFPNQLDDFLTNNNLYYDGDLFVNGSITKLFSDIKFDKVVFCETSPAPIDQIKTYLDQGKPVVVSLLNYGIRHYILAVGYDGDKMYVNDPWQGDQVAINDRWGDPKLKILQVNFFSGIPATNQVVTPPVVIVQPPITQPSQPVQPADPGGDENGINIPAPVVTQPVAVVPPVVQPPADNAQETAPTFIDSLKSRKFILSVGAAVFAFLNSKFNLGLTEIQVWMIIIPLMAFVITEGLADMIERFRK